MANAKKTAKKVTKTAGKKTPAELVVWVISERKFLTWKPILVIKSYTAATTTRRDLESKSGMTTSYKLDRSVLVK